MTFSARKVWKLPELHRKELTKAYVHVTNGILLFVTSQNSISSLDPRLYTHKTHLWCLYSGYSQQIMTCSIGLVSYNNNQFVFTVVFRGMYVNLIWTAINSLRAMAAQEQSSKHTFHIHHSKSGCVIDVKNSFLSKKVHNSLYYCFQKT
jgi:hypothetical protein